MSLIRDIFDHFNIAIVLVGTDRLDIDYDILKEVVQEYKALVIFDMKRKNKLATFLITLRLSLRLCAPRREIIHTLIQQRRV